MAEVTFDVTPATPQKRRHEEDDCVIYGGSSTLPSAHKSSTSEHSSRNASPAPSSMSSLTELTNIDHNPACSTSTTTGPPAKKPKLTFLEKEAEKAARQREKDEKIRAKAEEKARKDEERRKANEEKEAAKRAKELEKAEKQKAKDAEKKEKDAKKQLEQEKKDAKEAEKLKKERAQMRLGAFFGKPKPEATPPSTPDDVSEGASSRRSSIASIDMERPVFDTRPATKPSNPDFDKFILPFYVPEHTDVAPTNRYKLGRISTFEIRPNSSSRQHNVHEHFGRPRKRRRMNISVKEIMKNVQASGLDLIELDSTALDALYKTSYKSLQFREDVRPPYQGTYSRLVSPRSSRRLSRNPFSRNLPDTNYDYDSEAEWEPPGEDDEDLENDDEMSDAEDNEDEMDDFLDDADDSGRRKGPVIDMEPVSSGLCWVGEAFNDKGLNLQQYKMDVLHDSTTFPIDPFSTTHWTDECKPKSSVRPEPSTSSMPPPRPALSSLSPNAGPAIKQETGIDGKPLPIQPKTNAGTTKKTLKMIDPEFMPAFKRAVDGNDMTKAGLIEVLKKQFPKCSKDAIKDTLGAIAVRVGKKEAEKKWQLVEAN